MEKNFLGLAEDKFGDCISMNLTQVSGVKVTFLGDFNGGDASITFGNSGLVSPFSVVGIQGDNSVQLVNSAGQVAWTLHGERSTQSEMGTDGIKFFPDLPLAQEQTLRLARPRMATEYSAHYKLRVNCLSI
ncbi:Uncharacterised protein [Buttiauxella agrestis]|uniref:Uncharacterized protein n=1 Tax=Buttiauxella agrestis TaxID=82977 RepID=A0A381C608_9ENTR|nr:hypothetical protein [Buttiauxella agrestis]SUW63280.1 Uncharacterised protein [Buttiauxella agrestis]